MRFRTLINLCSFIAIAVGFVSAVRTLSFPRGSDRAIPRAQSISTDKRSGRAPLAARRPLSRAARNMAAGGYALRERAAVGRNTATATSALRDRRVDRFQTLISRGS